MKRPATPKQIAYFSYLGVKKAKKMSFDQASALFDKLLEAEDKDLAAMGFKSYEEYSNRKDQWYTERFILHPDLYADEIQRMLDHELPELLHSYARGQVVGASERLTKPKIKKVITSLSEESSQWWLSKNRNKIFFRKLTELYPNCVDGRSPDKSKSKSKMSNKREEKKKGVGCGCLIIIGLIVIGSLFIFELI